MSRNNPHNPNARRDRSLAEATARVDDYISREGMSVDEALHLAEFGDAHDLARLGIGEEDRPGIVNHLEDRVTELELGIC